MKYAKNSLHFIKHPVFIVFVIFSASLNGYAQSRQAGYLFKSADLMTIAQKLVGDSTAWQIVISQAERKTTTNEFLLSATAQKNLRLYAQQRQKVNESRKTFNVLIQDGARVLAEIEFQNTQSALVSFDKSTHDGDLSSAINEGSRFVLSIPKLQKAVVSRRKEKVEAKLVKKTGDVDKRKDLLSVWKTAEVGEFFSESNALRTASKSNAQLLFIDGSQVVIDQNTTAQIRASRRDKIDQTFNADVALIKGNLLALLSKQTQDAGTFNLSAGSSRAIVHSGKFWASTSESNTAKISNYDGSIEVKSGDAIITLKKNQGTVVLRGKEPLPPIELLPSPRLQWGGLDTVLFVEEFQLQWNPIPKTSKYQIELSPSPSFENNVTKYSSTSSTIRLKKLPLNVTYIRLQAIDRLGLRGADSPTYRLLRNPDTESPYIYLSSSWFQSGDTLSKFTALSELTIAGETEPGAHLLVDGYQQTVNDKGIFAFNVVLSNQNEKVISLTARDKANNLRQRYVRIIPIRFERIYALAWNCKSSGDTLYSHGEVMQVSGIGYPNLSLSLTHGSQTFSALADAQGRWAIAVPPLANQSLTVSFASPDLKQKSPIRTYFVK